MCLSNNTALTGMCIITEESKRVWRKRSYPTLGRCMSIHITWTAQNKNIAVTIQDQTFVVLNNICGIFVIVNYEVHHKILSN
jgi:hypothetical protein